MTVGLDCAGAATAGACGLCLAGTYQTGSGPSRQLPGSKAESAQGAVITISAGMMIFEQ